MAGGAIVPFVAGAGAALPAVTKAGLGLKKIGQAIGIGGGVLGIGAGLNFGMELPYQMEQSILRKGPVTADDKFRPNFVQRLITGMDADDFKDKQLDIRLDDVEGSKTASLARALNVRQPLRGETQVEYEAGVAPLIRTAQETRDFLGVGSQYARAVENRTAGLLESQMMREFNRDTRAADRTFKLDKEALQEKVDSRIGQQDLLELQMINSKQSEANELAFRREMANSNRTQNIIASLATLGTAFAI